MNDNLSFGQRYGFEPLNIPYQIDDMNDELRTELWNQFYRLIYQPSQINDFLKKEVISLLRNIWGNHLKKRIDECPSHIIDLKNAIKKYFFECEWFKVYMFFEYLLKAIETHATFQHAVISAYINEKLKANNSGYSIVSGKFIPIVNDLEIKEIKNTAKISLENGLTGVQNHLKSALDLIAQKPLPDYRNSIKESISMVEVISRIIEPENTLGKALNKLDKNKKINSSLKTAFEKLYIYTNDKNGIRHGLMDDSSIGPEDAKFFLVACSAFTNYLIEKAIQSNLLK